MIELERHIEILLLDNDCVIVPELGGFMAHHVEARYDEEEKVFLPPFRTLGFNPQLKINDSLLAQSYIEAYDLSYPEALMRIQDEVNELKQHLNNNGRYDLNDIGTLTVNNDGNIEFSPCDAGILSPNFYGLSSFEFNTIAVAEQEYAIETSETNIFALKPDGSQLSKDNDEEDCEIRIKKTWLHTGIAVAAAVLALFIFSLPITNGKMSQISDIHLPMLGKLMPKDTNMKDLKFSIITDTVSPNSSPEVSKRKTNTVSSVKEQYPKRYCIILASQVSRHNADFFVKKLHSEGFENAEVYVHNNMVRVVYGCFATESEAYNVLRKLHSNTAFTDAWVYRKKDI